MTRGLSRCMSFLLARNGSPAMSTHWSLTGGKRTSRLRWPRSENDPQRTSSRLWPALASALVAHDWTVELTGLITSRGQRKLAPAGARSGVQVAPQFR